MQQTPILRPSLLGIRGSAIVWRVVIYVLLAALSVSFVLPFLWMISTSLKQSQDVFSYPPSFLPNSFEWQNYPKGWRVLPFNTFLTNSLIVTFANVIGNLISCSLVAYGFARLKGRGRDFLFLMLLATLMIPREVTIIPRFLMFSAAGLTNTLWPLILPAWFGYAFFIFLLRQFFMPIPIELEEAAILDGANRFRIWWQIMMPLCKPALATVAVFTFQGVWNDFYGPLIFLTNPEKYTVALGISFFRELYNTQIPLMMAMSFLMVIPTLLAFFLAQRLMIRGVVMTGLKG